MMRNRARSLVALVTMAAMIAISGAAAISCGDVDNGSDTGEDVQIEDTSTGVDAVTSATKFQCTVCDYIYDPAVGDPAQGVPAGTTFYDLPEAWTCPNCGAAQSLFEVLH